MGSKFDGAALTRRRFLVRLGVAASAMALPLIAACGGQQPAAPAKTESKPAESKPAESKPAAPAAQAQPTAAPAKPAESKPAEAKPAQAAPGSTQTTKMLVWFNAAWNDVSNKAIGDPFVEWGKKNNVEVEYEVLAAQQVAKISAAIQAGNPPEIMEANPSIAYWVKLEEVVDLSDVYGRLKAKGGGFWPIVEKAVTFPDGKQWGLAFECYPWPMVARKDVWEKDGAKFPATWDEFAERGKSIQQPPRTFAAGLATGREDDHFDNFTAILWAHGGQLMDDQARPSFQKDPVVKTLDLYKKLWDAKMIPEDSMAATVTSWNNENYQKKRILSAINPPTIWGNLVVNDKELLDQSWMYPLPGGPAGSFTQVTLKNWVIYKKSRNADRAKDALEYVMQPEVIQKIADSAAGRSVPPFKDLANTEFWKKPPYDALVKIVGEVGRPRYYPFGESAWGAAVISAQPIATMLENHLQKNMPADQAYQAAFQEIQTQYEKFK